MEWRNPVDLLADTSVGPIVAGLAASGVVLWALALALRMPGIDVDPLYPDAVTPAEAAPPSGATAPPQTAGSEETPSGEGETCPRSETIATMSYLLGVLVDDNVWAPADPMYKIGFFGLVPFEATPWFDNQASFQLGALSALRRMAVEFVDGLGRSRGTTAADEDLQAARNALFVSASAWRFNPFDDQAPTVGTPADKSYRDARRFLERYNARLRDCEASFDPRSDNLFNAFDRIAKDMGGTTAELGRRSNAYEWSVEQHRVVPAEGSNAGIFDFRADNYFHEARGMMWAYHGMLRALRTDFQRVVEQRDLGEVWNRLEKHVAESILMDPWIVSNGRTDAVFMPDHLAVMAMNILRARANLTEARDILNR